MKSTRRRCRVQKNTGPSSCQHVRTWALQIDLCQGLVCSTVVFGSLKTHQGRRTDPVTPITHMSELEAWAIVTFPPIVPWERTISVPVSCCSISDKTTLLNMRPHPPLKYTNTEHAENIWWLHCWQLVQTHIHSYHLIHTFLLDTLLNAYMYINVCTKYRRAPKEIKTGVCWKP